MSPVTPITVTLDESCIVIDEKIAIQQEKQEQPAEEGTQLNQLIFFDLETGGLSSESDILQIAAVDHDGHEFNVYCRPTRPISKTASRINQLTYKDNVMYYRKKPVSCQDIRDALVQFASFLESQPVSVILVAHNAPFDKRFLTHHISLHNLQCLFYPKLMGYANTVRYFKAYKPTLPNYTLKLLTQQYLPKAAADTLHNALTDVLNLQLLFRRLVLNVMIGERQAKDANALIRDFVYQKVDLQGKNVESPKKKKQIVCTYEKRVTKVDKHVTYSMKNEITEAELSFGCRLTRSGIKAIPLTTVNSDLERNKPNGRLRRASTKRQADNQHFKSKKNKTTY